MVTPLGNNSSTQNNEPCSSSYILQNFRRRKWPVSADVYVNCITELLVFFFNCEKTFAKWHVYFSFLVQEQTVLLCSLEIPLFSSCDLTCLNFFEFILPKEKKIQAKFDFIILRWINHKTPPLSQTGCNIYQIQKIKYIQHWVFVQLSSILQQSQWQNLCVIIIEWVFFFFLVTLFRVGYFLSVAYLTVANLARLGISVHF